MFFRKIGKSAFLTLSEVTFGWDKESSDDFTAVSNTDCKPQGKQKKIDIKKFRLIASENQKPLLQKFEFRGFGVKPPSDRLNFGRSSKSTRFGGVGQSPHCSNEIEKIGSSLGLGEERFQNSS